MNFSRRQRRDRRLLDLEVQRNQIWFDDTVTRVSRLDDVQLESSASDHGSVTRDLGLRSPSWLESTFGSTSLDLSYRVQCRLLATHPNGYADVSRLANLLAIQRSQEPDHLFPYIGLSGSLMFDRL